MRQPGRLASGHGRSTASRPIPARLSSETSSKPGAQAAEHRGGGAAERLAAPCRTTDAHAWHLAGRAAIDRLEGDRSPAGHLSGQGAKPTVPHRRAFPSRRRGGTWPPMAPATCIRSHPHDRRGLPKLSPCPAGAAGHVPRCRADPRRQRQRKAAPAPNYPRDLSPDKPRPARRSAALTAAPVASPTTKEDPP